RQSVLLDYTMYPQIAVARMNLAALMGEDFPPIVVISHCFKLRSRTKRPSHRAAEQRHEFAAPIKKTIGHDAIPRGSATGTLNVSPSSSSRVGGKAGA